MKAAHDYVQAQRAELPAEIERARKLVRLHADQPDHAATGGADAFGHGGHIDDGVAFVAGIDLNIDIGAEHAIVGAFPHQPIDAGERVRRKGRAQPLDDIAVPVVMRRLDQLDPKRALGQITVQTTPPDGTRLFPRQSPATLRVRPPLCNNYLARWRGACDSLSPRAGRGWGEGAIRWAQSRGAQNRGEAPSPSFATLSRLLPARRGAGMRDHPRNASATELSRHCEERSDEAIQRGLV